MKLFPSAAASVLIVAATSTQASPARLPFELLRGEVFARPGGSPLKADVYISRRPGPRPGVLLIHGGAWQYGSRRSMSSLAAKLAARGFSAVTIDYRLAPGHKFPAQIEDCRAALRWMGRRSDALRIDPQRIGGVGMSAGGQLVMLLATDRPTAARAPQRASRGGPSSDPPAAGPPAAGEPSLRAVVGLAAPCDFRRVPPDTRALAFWLGGTRRELPDLYRSASPAAFASADDPPALLVHGTEDPLVPLASPQGMAAALRGVGVRVELMPLEGLGHTAPMWKPDAVAKTIGFLEAHLSPDRVPSGPGGNAEADSAGGGA